MKTSRHHLALLALPALALAACGTSSPATPVGNPAPASSASVPAQGPLTVTTDHCGKFSRAQQLRYTTNARSGLVLTVVNRAGGSDPIPLTVQANFLNGTELAGQNVTGVSPAIGEGQSEKLEMDSPDGWDADGTCQIIAYTVFKPGTVDPNGTYQVKG